MPTMRTARRKSKKSVDTPASQKVVIRLDAAASAEIETSPRWVYIDNPSNKLLIQYGTKHSDDPVQSSFRVLPGADRNTVGYVRRSIADDMQTIPRNARLESQRWTANAETPRARKERRGDAATPSPKPQRPGQSSRQQLQEPESSATQHFQAELEDQAAAISKATATITALCEDNTSLRSQLERQTTKHRQQLLDSCAVAKRAVEARQQLWSEFQGQAAEARQAREEVDKLCRKSAELESQLWQLADVADRVKAENKVLKQEVKLQKQDDLKSKQEQESYITTLEEEVRRLKGQLYDEQKRAHSEKLLTDEALLEKESAQLERAEAVAEVQRLRFQLDERAGAASSARLEAEGLRRNVVELEGQVASQRQQQLEAIDLARQERSYSRELEVEVAQLKQRLQDKALAASQARAEAEGLRRQVAEMGGQLEEQRRQVAEMQPQLDATQRDAAPTGRTELESLRRTMTELRAQLEEQRRQLSQASNRRQEEVVEVPRALPPEILVYCTGDNVRTNSILRFSDRGGRPNGNPEITVFCKCRAVCEPGAWVSPTDWSRHQGLAGRSWSDDIKVDLAQFPELRLGDGKSVCSVGKFLNLHGYEWNRASVRGGCPTLTLAFQPIGPQTPGASQ